MYRRLLEAEVFSHSWAPRMTFWKILLMSLSMMTMRSQWPMIDILGHCNDQTANGTNVHFRHVSSMGDVGGIFFSVSNPIVSHHNADTMTHDWHSGSLCLLRYVPMTFFLGQNFWDMFQTLLGSFFENDYFFRIVCVHAVTMTMWLSKTIWVKPLNCLKAFWVIFQGLWPLQSQDLRWCAIEFMKKFLLCWWVVETKRVIHAVIIFVQVLCIFVSKFCMLRPPKHQKNLSWPIWVRFARELWLMLSLVTFVKNLVGQSFNSVGHNPRTADNTLMLLLHLLFGANQLNKSNNCNSSWTTWGGWWWSCSNDVSWHVTTCHDPFMHPWPCLWSSFVVLLILACTSRFFLPRWMKIVHLCPPLPHPQDVSHKDWGAKLFLWDPFEQSELEWLSQHPWVFFRAAPKSQALFWPILCAKWTIKNKGVSRQWSPETLDFMTNWDMVVTVKKKWFKKVGHKCLKVWFLGSFLGIQGSFFEILQLWPLVMTKFFWVMNFFFIHVPMVMRTHHSCKLIGCKCLVGWDMAPRSFLTTMTLPDTSPKVFHTQKLAGLLVLMIRHPAKKAELQQHHFSQSCVGLCVLVFPPWKWPEFGWPNNAWRMGLILSGCGHFS